jgi:hypothetical protein
MAIVVFFPKKQSLTTMDAREHKILLSLLGVVLLLGLPILYTVNASHVWRSGGLIPIDHIAFLPASAFPAGSMTAIWHTALFAIGLLLASLLPAKLRTVLVWGVLAGTFGIVLFALHQRMQAGSVYDWTTLFVSRNQFAAFACLSFPLGLVLGARCKYQAFLSGQLSNPSGICYLASGLLAGAVVQTGSRAGMVVLVLQTIGFVLIILVIRHRYPIVISPPSALYRACIIGALILGVGVGGLALSRNYAALRSADLDFNFRRVVRHDTHTMWRSQIWWGIGPGSFEKVFPYYQSLPVEEYFFRHAHCEPLQLLSEYGLLGSAITLLGIGLILAGAGQTRTRDQQIPPRGELEGCGFGLALGGVFLHGWVDFPFRHPLILFVVAVWLASLVQTLRENSETLK